MQKVIMNSVRIVAFVFLSGLIPSCKKDIEKKPFNLNTRTFYRISPTVPEPLVVNGVNYVSAAFSPGGGKGTAMYLGEIGTFFNRQTYSPSVEGAPHGWIGAPLTDIPSYPLLSGPLPLIQPGDFTELASLISSLRIPEAVHGKIVSTIIYNSMGDAVFFSTITGTVSTFPDQPTLITFKGKALIVGGRGKYSNAIGEIDFDGYFSRVYPDDATYNAQGWIDF